MEAKQIVDRLRQDARSLAERMQLLRFWRWWTSQLSSLVPTKARDWYLRRKRVNVAELADDRFVVRSESLEGWMERARLDLAGMDPPAQAAAIRNELNRAFPEEQLPHRLALAIPAQHCLRKKLRLPAAVEENLNATLAFEMDRYTPFRADQVYFDSTVVGRDYEARQIDVAVAVAMRPWVDAARSRLEQAGAQIAAAWPGTEGSQGLNLLPVEQRPPRRLDIRWETAAGVGVLALLLLAAIILPVWQLREQVKSLHPVVAKTREQAYAADGLRRRLDTMVSDYNFLIDKKRSNPSVVQVLDEVTRLLPDDTWVQQFEIKTDPKAPGKPREVQMQGETGSSGKMIGLIENARYLQQASWKSPIVSGPVGAGERFHIAAQVKSVAADAQAAAPTAPTAATAPAAPAATQAPAAGTAPGTPPSPSPAAGAGGGPAAAPAAASAPGAPGASPATGPQGGPPATSTPPAAPASAGPAQPVPKPSGSAAVPAAPLPPPKPGARP
jgi:general secretion pathway protein L